jgi:hypothetical protein
LTSSRRAGKLSPNNLIGNPLAIALKSWEEGLNGDNAGYPLRAVPTGFIRTR